MEGQGDAEPALTVFLQHPVSGGGLGLSGEKRQWACRHTAGSMPVGSGIAPTAQEVGWLHLLGLLLQSAGLGT